jgi:hypothetical protein
MSFKDDKGVTEDIPKLKQLDFVDSLSYINEPGRPTRSGYSQEAIGSVQIDQAFQQEANRRLDLICREDGIPHIPEYAADEMAKGEFQDIKRKFGTREVSLPEYKFAVSSLPKNFSNAEAKIEDGMMIFTR